MKTLYKFVGGHVRAVFDRACGFSHEVTRTTLYRGKERTITNTVS